MKILTVIILIGLIVFGGAVIYRFNKIDKQFATVNAEVTTNYQVLVSSQTSVANNIIAWGADELKQTNRSLLNVRASLRNLQAKVDTSTSSKLTIAPNSPIEYFSPLTPIKPVQPLDSKEVEGSNGPKMKVFCKMGVINGFEIWDECPQTKNQEGNSEGVKTWF